MISHQFPDAEQTHGFGIQVASILSKTGWKESVMRPNESNRSRFRYRVLCVDDNEFGAYVKATILRREGYEVLACCDALEAAAIAKAEEIDLAVLSYQMPVINGAELAALCKAANPDLKVILLSEWLGIPRRDLAFSDLFLLKSDDMHALLAGAEALLPVNRFKALPKVGIDHNGMIRTEN
jgi:CheY-like chemotaxis protein